MSTLHFLKWHSMKEKLVFFTSDPEISLKSIDTLCNFNPFKELNLFMKIKTLKVSASEKSDFADIQVKTKLTFARKGHWRFETLNAIFKFNFNSIQKALLSNKGKSCVTFKIIKHKRKGLYILTTIRSHA